MPDEQPFHEQVAALFTEPQEVEMPLTVTARCLKCSAVMDGADEHGSTIRLRCPHCRADIEVTCT